MKAFIIATLARQIEGEYCLLKVEKGFVDKNKAELYAAEQSKYTTETIATPVGSLKFLCERGIFEIEIEE